MEAWVLALTPAAKAIYSKAIDGLPRALVAVDLCPSPHSRPRRRFFPVRRALISDIHANLEALDVVLDDIRKQGIDEIFCLGDIIGYGPNPRECIDRVMDTCRFSLLGNHDQGALFDPDGFNIGAERAIFWTREQLENPHDRANERRWEYLGELPRTYRVNSFLFVHGSPRNPLSEYIFPEDIYNHRKMERLFQLVEKYCFQGHTHVPGVFTESFQFFAPEEIDNEYTLGEGKVLINVGSVGQPRDGDPRACYVILEDGLPPDASPGHADGEREGPETGDYPAVGESSPMPAPVGPVRVTFRRLAYDFETTIKKIYDISELEPFLGDRLRQGR
jgi:diadenosine tetraphosphatase ApaH/serine/threonine PP2A family protein phosphatase